MMSQIHILIAQLFNEDLALMSSPPAIVHAIPSHMIASTERMRTIFTVYLMILANISWNPDRPSHTVHLYFLVAGFLHPSSAIQLQSDQGIFSLVITNLGHAHGEYTPVSPPIAAEKSASSQLPEALQVTSHSGEVSIIEPSGFFLTSYIIGIFHDSLT